MQPSLEIFAYHPELAKWVEVGNSGMFRPEMLAPMGFPKDVHVHGWGISLERPTMIRCVFFLLAGIWFADFGLFCFGFFGTIPSLLHPSVWFDILPWLPALDAMQ